MALRVNLSCENFHARDPCFLDLALAPVRGQQLAGLDTPLSKLLHKRHGAIITRTDCASSIRVDTLPEALFAFGHFTNLILSEAKNLTFARAER
jgi:hypothetical protein